MPFLASRSTWWASPRPSVTRIRRDGQPGSCEIDPLTLFGALAVTAMLLFYALEARSAAFVLAFAGACLASSAYGFLQGAWPFGVVELIWSGIALQRWQVRRT
jgi:hypothetical protein